MKPLRLAIVGYGRLGRACAETILESDDIDLAGIVRRPEHVATTSHAAPDRIRIVADLSELAHVDAALLCLPPDLVVSTAHDLLQHKTPVVECAALHGEEFRAHREAIDRIATRRRVPAIVGAGWDPGASSMFRLLFALLTPKGQTTVRDRPGVSLRHSLSVRSLPGVKDALCTEQRAADGPLQRYVYVELENGTDFEDVAEQVRGDPLFANEETLVFAIDSVAAFEEAGHGVVMERRGSAGPTAHQRFLLEARFDPGILAAQVMLAAARTVRTQPPGAHALSDIPLSRLAEHLPRLGGWLP